MYYRSYQVSNTPDTTDNDLIGNAINWIKQNNGIMIAIGVIGLLAYHKTNTQKNSYIKYGTLAAKGIGILGGYGLLISGGKLGFGALGQ